MGLAHSPRIVTDRLALCLDAGNSKSDGGGGFGFTWNDISGNGFHGSGNQGQAISNGYVTFNEAFGDYVSFSNEPDLNGKSFSAGCWYRTTDSSMRLIQNASTGSFGTKNGFQISITSATSWSNTGITSTNGSYIQVTGVDSSTAIDGNWHCVCLTFDTFTGKGELYLDGTSLYSNTVSGLIGANLNGAGLELGRANSNQQYLDGDIACAFMYTKALTSEEVQQNFNALRGRFGI